MAAHHVRPPLSHAAAPVPRGAQHASSVLNAAIACAGRGLHAPLRWATRDAQMGYTRRSDGLHAPFMPVAAYEAYPWQCGPLLSTRATTIRLAIRSEGLIVA